MSSLVKLHHSKVDHKTPKEFQSNDDCKILLNMVSWLMFLRSKVT